jgi:tRNA-dihydrouridine synthase
MYKPGLRYDLIALAAREMRCAVFANGNVHSAPQAQTLLAETGVRGLMIGRGAIRNPWLFDQIRAEISGTGILPVFDSQAGSLRYFKGKKIKLPTGRDVLNYIRELWENEITPGVKESSQVMRMKKFMNFIGDGVGEKFLHEIRRVTTTADFFRVCENHLAHEELMTLEPISISEAALELPAVF